MFDKILIANRGEIACRIIKSCKRLGVACVAVYSDPDVDALHVQLADVAYHLGPAPSIESYLRSDLILDIAKKSGAQAIHPGYGFLSENAEFAKDCEQAGITFIGPSSDAILKMGSKSEAKAIMEKAGVPVVPGFHGDKQTLVHLQKQAIDIGFPVLIKAVAGGGGKGMRIVEKEAEFKEALASCKREAKSSFNDDHVLLEKYLAQPRHIEVQIFADTHGNTVHLFERDCSIQRRHQKIIEEAPAPNLSAKLRKSMSDAAIAAAKAINYVGAGTIEFLVENNQFYFMEMNTRLQVEHPVTEKVTGYDLVEWQLRVAAGEKLPVKQSDIKINGHAIESRIYAEDPSNNFLPSIGHIAYLNTPKTNDDIRIDAGVQSGDDITPFYDPMIAKLITFAPDRETALHKLQKCLSEFHVVGINTNISFLNEITKHTAFQTAKYDTKFVDAHAAALTPRGELSIEIKLLACLFVLSQQEQAMHTQALASKESNSPWLMSHNWRLNLSTSQQINLFENENNLQFKVNKLADLYQISFDDKIYHASATMTENLIQATIGGESIHATIVEYQKEIHLFVNEFHHVLNRFDPDTYYQQAEAGSGHLNAPLPGTVVAVMTKKGKKVTAGDSLIVLEAMKMEHTIHAPAEGTIKEIYFNVGDLVNEGEELIRIE